MGKPYYRDDQGNLRVNPCTSIVYNGIIMNSGDIIPETQKNEQNEQTEEVENE